MKRIKILLAIVAVWSNFNTAFGQTWTQTTAPTNNLNWASVASSADGSHIVAVASTPTYPYNGPIYISADSGGTWISNTISPKDWVDVASSADATKLVAVDFNGQVYTSTNAGTFSFISLAPQNLYCVASSADSTKLVMAGLSVSGSIYISTNSGVTLSPASGTSGMIWRSVASSADGTKMVAVNQRSGTPGGSIYTSTDLGNSWVSNNAPNLYWVSVASSADGHILAAAPGGFNLGYGPICVSTNSGVTWMSNNSPILAWKAVALSADGGKMIAAAIKVNGNSTFSNSIFTSTDFGVTWTTNNVPAENWTSIATSADGNMSVAVTANGGIWISQTTPSPQLNLTPTNTNLGLSWLIPSTNVILQQSSDLISWVNLTNQPTLNLTNLNNELVLSPTNSSGFFRLSTP
jgi:hypothetical protein